jgi:3-oxoacyl-[acyl-carrier protein] reductase
MTASKVIVITGASKGIGAELAIQFAAEEHHVVINYAHNEAAVHEVYQRIVAQHDPATVLKIKADVTRRAEVCAMFDQAVAHLGRVDALINNAGLNWDGPFVEMTDEQWERVLATNLTGTFLCAQEFVRHLNGAAGHIVNIAASTGLRGRKNGVNYCASKAGVITLTKCLALELAPQVCVNCVIPGFIDTAEVVERYHLDEPEARARAVSTIPLGRLGTPGDIFTMVNFLVNNATYITGQNFCVNGGNFMP